ncbi:glycogen synthase [Aureibaculum marinum]|uniref:Glycogen synthase n=1 Tax=Aureibaculum marinum TaxID=2487930 RepID=A0A3N4NK95_9FLAO|nr:glycogen/starch synthase [Aureibaculum marinum]RPD96641.1 glycogen synthase [Aureibaculum marinum]
MNILHVSAECYPIAKVGGLADVVGSLPKYQNKLGVTSEVIMPFYDNAFTKTHSFKTIISSKVKLGVFDLEVNILTLENNNLGYDLFLVDIPTLLFKNYVYSSEDTERFLAFQIAVLDWVIQRDKKPTIIHCHDHHTGLIPFMMAQSHKYSQLKKVASITTIHNAQYQGWFSHDKVYMIPEFDFNQVGLIDWDHQINPLAAAIKCAWKVTTVSPSYMEELKSSANGLESLLSHESGKCVGILNGIDTQVWNPETDDYIVKNYSQKTLNSGRNANKDWLCKEFNLDPEKPLFSFIGRLVGEKGADLFPKLFDTALEHLDINILLLGSGATDVEDALEMLTYKYKGKYNAYIGYDEKLAHIIYAGADFLLMPSRVEPCGLNQMYALRYGTIPIVNSIGGLKDTVIDVEGGGFGFIHHQLTVEEIVKTMERALVLYKNQKKFKNIRKLIMEIDHSWDSSAKAYINLYKSLNN